MKRLMQKATVGWSWLALAHESQLLRFQEFCKSVVKHRSPLLKIKLSKLTIK